MFGIELAMAQLMIAQHEREAFKKALAAMPEHMQPAFEKAHREMLEKRHQEATAERRHRELCDAIRDSRPRGIGLFL